MKIENREHRIENRETNYKGYTDRQRTDTQIIQLQRPL